MPRRPLHTLIWLEDQGLYARYTQGQLVQRFQAGEDHTWLAWLREAPSFAFQCPAGRLNVYQEKRPRGGRYWYAYHTSGRRTRKRYLGPTATVTLARLEVVAKALSSEPSSAPVAPSTPLEQGNPWGLLLSTKLAPPPLTRALVARERLLDRLDAARTHRLTLLSASAGWGKTTLLATWASRSGCPIAWLSLDEGDNDPTRFWAAVLAALRTCLPRVGEVALAMLHSPQPPPLPTTLTTLLHDLSAVREPTFLLLDDYHLIAEQAIHDSLLFVLEHLPTHLHLVLSSRIDPPLALSRWRVRGHLLELRDADLRFHEEEAARFLAQTMDLALSGEAIAELARRTEGWIAGLHLAALSLRHHEDPAAFVRGFTGSYRYVLDYVQEEILPRLPAPLQDFLLQSAILNRMTASLCQAVTEELASAEMLERIERANLFLVPLDDERRWYRLHDLFREALLARLYATRPEVAPLLHQRAARWYEAQAEWREAIAHALAATDFSYAACLIEQTAEQFWLRGEATTVYHWVIALPDAMLREHTRLALTTALQVLQANQYSMETAWQSALAQVEHLMARIAALLRTRADAFSEAEAVLVRQRLHMLRLLIKLREATWNNDKDALRGLDQQQIRDLDETDDILWQMIPLASQFMLHASPIGDGDTEPLLVLLQPAKQKALAAGDHYAAMKLMQWIAHMYLPSGRLQAALQECLEALAFAKQISGFFSSVIWLHSYLVFIYYRRNQLEAARASLEQELRSARDWQNLDMLIGGYTYWILILLVEGNLPGAHHAMQELEESIQHQRLFPYYTHNLVWLRLRLYLAGGDMEQATRMARQARNVLETEQADPTEVAYFLVAELARLSLALRQPEEAIQTLMPYLEREELVQWQDTLIHLLPVYSVALYQAGKCEQARAVVVRLLTLTAPEGYVRVYLEAGEPMRQMLKTLLEEPQDDEERVAPMLHSYVRALLAAFEQEEQRHALRADVPPIQAQEHETLSEISSRLTVPAASTPTLLTPLTPQEQRVLRLLAAGHSNQEIARTLVVSLNTVKTHIKQLYSKLQVNNRIQASVLARDLHML
jgi:LuxR family maltose regulon positive regulatory protein